MDAPRAGAGPGGDSDEVKARRYDRLTAMAQAAEAFEGRAWADEVHPYFVVMRSIRTDPDLWFGGATNGRVRARQIHKSIVDAIRALATRQETKEEQE